MGKKGEKRTGDAAAAAEAAVAGLAPMGDVTSKGMFGGYGIFLDGVMFGLIDSSGALHLRVSDDTRGQFEKAGGEAHGRMPYYSVPEAVRSDGKKLLTWAQQAGAVAKAAKK